MYRYSLVAILSVLLIACGQNEDAEPRQVAIAKQQLAQVTKEKQDAEKKAAVALANQKVAEEKAAIDNSSSQRIIFGLSVGALLAFFFGVGLGSSTRKVAGKPANE